MSPVELKKRPCCPVKFNGQGSICEVLVVNITAQPQVRNPVSANKYMLLKINQVLDQLQFVLSRGNSLQWGKWP